MRIKTIFSLAALLTAAMASAIPAAATEYFQTQSGLMHYKGTPSGEKEIRLGNALLFTADVDGIDFTLLRSSPGHDIVLVFLSSGGTACPGLYRLVDTGARPPRVTEEFGTCSDIPTIRWQGDAVFLSFPSMSGDRPSAWSYTPTTGLKEVTSEPSVPSHSRSSLAAARHPNEIAVTAPGEIECISMFSQLILAAQLGREPELADDRLLDERAELTLSCAALAKCDQLGSFALTKFIERNSRGSVSCRATAPFRDPDRALQEFPKMKSALEKILQYVRSEYRQ